jgi:hypothetical protein
MDQVQQDKLLAQRGATLQLRALQVAPKLRQVHTLTVQAQMDQVLQHKTLATHLSTPQIRAPQVVPL